MTSRKAIYGTPILSGILADVQYEDIQKSAEAFVQFVAEKYQGQELEAALRIILSITAQKLYDVQEWDNDS